MEKKRKNKFVKAILLWNSSTNKRKMPWKGEKNPYRIWLSEIILQQTRVEQGLAYYLNFIKNYPTVEKLAQASDNDVFKHWEGLGYYSRCRNLLISARYIVNELDGKFPDNYHSILRLKGVGTYTAAAIASFAFNEPKAVVDGNVYRLLSRYFNIDIPIDTNTGKKYFATLAEELLPVAEPGMYNQAIMDFGATVCKPKPSCGICPFNNTCMAFNEGIQHLLPVKNKKLTRITRYFQFIILSTENSILVNKRTEKDIWHGLHQFLQTESNEQQSVDEFLNSEHFKKFSLGKYHVLQTSYGKQQLTHQTIQALFIHLRVKKLPKIKDHQQINFDEISKLAFPRLLQEQLAFLHINR